MLIGVVIVNKLFTPEAVHEFNILRRTGTGVKRKTSENQRFSEVFVGLIDLSVTPVRLELTTQ